MLLLLTLLFTVKEPESIILLIFVYVYRLCCTTKYLVVLILQNMFTNVL